MTPTLRSVRLFRYWAAAASRAVGTVMLLWWLPGWVTAMLGAVMGTEPFNPLSFLRYADWWGNTLGLGLACALVFGASRLARFLIPMPRPECPECGYAIRGEADRCPECGLNLGRAAGATPAR